MKISFFKFRIQLVVDRSVLLIIQEGIHTITHWKVCSCFLIRICCHCFFSLVPLALSFSHQSFGFVNSLILSDRFLDHRFMNRALGLFSISSDFADPRLWFLDVVVRVSRTLECFASPSWVWGSSYPRLWSLSGKWCPRRIESRSLRTNHLLKEAGAQSKLSVTQWPAWLLSSSISKSPMFF